jgi:hypothetical protein
VSSEPVVVAWRSFQVCWPLRRIGLVVSDGLESSSLGVVTLTDILPFGLKADYCTGTKNEFSFLSGIRSAFR